MKRFLSLIILSALTAVCVSAQIVLKAELSSRTVAAGGTFQVSYTLENAASVSEFKQPEAQGCKLLYISGPMNFSSVSNINGHVTRSQGIRYTVTFRAGDKAGSVTVSPVVMVSEGKKYTSNTVKVNVVEAVQDPYGGYGGYGGGYPAPRQQPQPESLKPLTHNDVFVRMSLNKTSVYEQEAVECRIILYTTAQATNLSYNTTPKIDGFLIEDASPTGNIDVQTVNEDGKTYYVYLLRKYLLFPQKTGELTINSGEYEINLIRQVRIRQSFYTYVIPQEDTFTTRSVTKTINVKALPEPRPAGFCGGVGTFKVSTELTPDDLATNMLGKLTYNISGTGNIKYIEAPKPVFPSTFEVDDQPESDSNITVTASGDNVTGNTSWTYEFVPRNVGDFKVNAGDFVYFDPGRDEYVTVHLPVYDMRIAKGSDSDVSANDLLSHEEMKDILPPVIGAHDAGGFGRPVVERGWYWLIWAILTVALLATVFIYRKQVKLRADVKGRRRARANKIARKRFELARQYMSRQENEKFYEELLRAMWGYVGDKLNIPGSQLTRDNVTQRLVDYGIMEEDINRFVALVDDLEMARYTPDAASSNPQTLYNHAVDVIDTMESFKPKTPGMQSSEDPFSIDLN